MGFIRTFIACGVIAAGLYSSSCTADSRCFIYATVDRDSILYWRWKQTGPKGEVLTGRVETAVARD